MNDSRSSIWNSAWSSERQRLPHQGLEPLHGVVGRTLALDPITPLQRLLELVAERLEIHDLPQPFQRVTRFRQCRIPVIKIEKSRLSPPRRPHPAEASIESSIRKHRQGFFKVSRFVRSW